MFKKYILASFFALLAATAFPHNPDASLVPLHTWHAKNQHPFHASFLMVRNDSVFLENEHDQVKAFLYTDLSKEDQHFIRGKIATIAQMNQSKIAAQGAPLTESKPVSNFISWLLGSVLLLFVFLTAIAFLKKSKKLALALSLSGMAFLCAFKAEITDKLLGTDPLFMDSAFEPFKPQVATHWDDTWFYVESNGLPTTHAMMTGITAWQQQVPIPQCYVGTNAWQIPRNPVLAATPVPVNQQHFLRGAVAIAANGIPIFNPYTNTGVDAFLDGQLDQWGGHCGRADDYHYHIAPMFLDTQTVDILPIAFALDGFAVYASLEPDGTPMLPLDGNHGHFYGTGAYHYHGTSIAPYMIGNMVGQVTEDATLQIIPQAKATPVRPSLTPLNGATITDFVSNPGGNGYTLTYTRNGQTFKVAYSWTTGGVYTYEFIGPTGTSTQTYNGQLPCTVITATHEISAFENSVVVFPNPSSGSISLKIKDLKWTQSPTVQIFDAQGKLVFQKEKADTGLEINGLARGVYFLKIKFEKGQISRKVLVQ